MHSHVKAGMNALKGGFKLLVFVDTLRQSIDHLVTSKHCHLDEL